MDLPGVRQLQSVCHVTNFLKHQVRAKVLITEHVVGASLNRLLNVRLQLDIHPVTNFKGSFHSILVSLGFHTLLSEREVLLNVFQHCVPLLQPLFQI